MCTTVESLTNFTASYKSDRQRSVPMINEHFAHIAHIGVLPDCRWRIGLIWLRDHATSKRGFIYNIRIRPFAGITQLA